jgi:serine phosphatase RsbU (regulator of sigma subunit)
LIILRDGEIIQRKADKQPVGNYFFQKPFTTHTVNLEKGDMIYLFSDGYADQFGGENGKKFKLKAFLELLKEIYSLPMPEQLAILDKKFEEWKGTFEQIDDVCVMGVRV